MSALEISRAKAAGYLVPRQISWWRWDKTGQIVEWADGRTIAFAGEIRGILARLSPRGLPHFGSILLLLAACRDGYLDEPSRRDVLLGHAGEAASGSGAPMRDMVSGVLAIKLKKVLQQVADGLDAVAALPVDLRRSTYDKALIVEAVLENAERDLDPAAAAVVLESLEGPLDRNLTPDVISPVDALQLFAAEIECLHPGLCSLDPEALRLRARTGLEQLPKPAELELPDELPPAQRVRELLSKLQNDPELAGVARLAQKLMAAVHVPRSLGAAEELPVGGISDLANRGSFDRLLVSELAHDDLTLAVRVAMNEALYLRRESPPRRPPPRRAILIDSGIRMWGVPRLFAASVGLALAATADSRGELHIYRAAADRAAESDLTSREGLIAHLESLEPEPHPGGALADFAKSAGSAEGEVEMIVITHADTLADDAFFRAANAAARGEWFAATVDAAGSFLLHACNPAGRKLVCAADLSLDDILNPPLGGTPLIIKDRDGKVPAIFFIEPFPLRLPYHADLRFSRVSEKYGLFTITTDGRLLQWDRPGKAARQLTAAIPRSKLREIIVDETQHVVHVVSHRGKQNQLVVISVDLETLRERMFTLGANQPQHVHYHLGVLYLIGRRSVDLVSISAARRQGVLPLPSHVYWRMGRFFSHSSGFLALAPKGAGAVLVPVPHTDYNELAIFDQPELGGPCVLKSDGSIKTTLAVPDEVIIPTKAFEKVRIVNGVSSDGKRIAIYAGEAGDEYGLDLTKKPLAWEKLKTSGIEWLLGDRLEWSHHSWPLLRLAFEGVFVDRHDSIGLYGAGGATAFGIQFDDDGTMKWAAHPTNVPMRSPMKFKPIEPPEPWRFGLKMVEWRDGSRAYLDERGMLHLKSSTSGAVEITLVLGTRSLAAWTSDGKLYGSTAFTEVQREQGLQTALLQSELRRFAAGIA